MMKTITYVNHKDGAILDSEVTDAPVPREGQPVMFLEREGFWQVREVRRLDDKTPDALVKVIRIT